MIDLHSARQDAIYVRNAGFGTAAQIIEELCDEVKRLTDAVAEERADVVAWLREEPERLVACSGHRHADGKPCFVMSPMPASELADAIERGEHRREGEP